MGTLVQLIGFPVLFLFRFFSRIKNPKSTDADYRKFSSFTILGSVYIVTGLLVSANSYMSSVGLLYLPVSTFSLILASQLAFTAFFSYFLNSQKFTPFIVNSLFLLTISSALLVVNTDSENTAKMARVKYVIGIICTIGASAGIGLLLSLVQLILRKVLKKQTFSTVTDLVAYQSLVASCVVLIGLFASGEWKTLTSEMENYKLGKAPYVMILASIAISWQVYTIGVVGLIFESSSVFSNSITAVGLPIVPVVAVIVFHDTMNASKIFSIILAIWGFISFVYQHYLDEKTLKTSHTSSVGDPHLPVEEGDQNLEANLISHEVTESSSVPQTTNYKRWFRVSIYVIFVLFCQPLATILGRLYYENGGNSTYVVTLLQLIGFPVLVLFRFFSRIRQPKSTDTNFSQSPSFTTLASVYLCTGLLVSAYAYLSAVGLLYLPVSTFSLILASQLAFTAFFSYFLNSQKFTPFIVNSLFLLTVSSALLVVNTDSENSTNVSRVQYVIGFICTIGASAGIGLLLSLIQLLFRKVFTNHTSSAVMDLAIYQSLVASCVVLIGLFASGEWETLPSEMRNYKLGKVSYVLTLASAAISWQVYTLGLVGLIFESSSVFSNSITAVGLPIVPVVAVIVFQDKMDASKIFSIILAIWGFLSFVYQHYLDEKKLKTSHTSAVEVLHLPVEEDHTSLLFLFVGGPINIQRL
ncbi:unnamed protein product [Arabidopsis arenosa]|uniref:Uncharacterized protein n=1 Tax=Arabidopsis arenosa TaxID=38785 RepID=A0A8S2ATX6_ARAAE|nr:unnamed protein product [Arabidopsis arenosa]